MRCLKFIVLVLLITAGACKEPEKEPTTLSDEKMIAIIVDLAVAESVTRELNYNARDSATITYYNQVFEFHQTTKEEFEKNLKIAGRDFMHIDRLYKSAEEILTEEKSIPKNENEPQ